MQNIDEQAKPPFSTEEIRILGCLMEKQLTTPNNYPLTMNSLMLACNQKTSREPLMNLKEGDVGHISRSLIEFGYAVIQNSGRAQRVEHRLSRKLGLNQKQQAILAVLMLRRPQTLNEIRTRTERMAEFSGPDEVLNILENWLTGDHPLVIRLPAGPGQREDRYYHTLGDEDLEALQTESLSIRQENLSSSAPVLDQETIITRIEELEKRIATLEALIS
ncbi:MAG: YceH family protein [Thiolinea sp.]